jgi:Uma2 family endonuclease
MSVAFATPASADEPLFEIIDGQRVELPPTGASETWLASYLATLINNFAMSSIGRAGVEVLFDLQIGRNRRPDVAFVRYDRWPRRQPIPPGDAWIVIPNLAVEVVSPSNTLVEVLDKLRDYFRARVQLVWVVSPQHRQIHVYTSPKDVTVLDQTDTLDGGDVIPGFKLPLATLFETEASVTATSLIVQPDGDLARSRGLARQRAR